MFIAGRKISSEFPPYVIAEISGNHCGDMNLALQLIRAAKDDAGADAVKLQAYEPEDLTINCDKPNFILNDGPWKGRKLYELYEKAHTPFKWFPWLFEQGKRYDIPVFASVFSKRGVDMLEKLDCPAYKIASMEIVDIPLIEYATSTGKPLIISTGMASEEEVEEVTFHVKWPNVMFLHCISGYPTSIEESGLWQLGRRKGGIRLEGISDHTVGWDVPVAATALGAQIIEKHMMLNETHPEDEHFSLVPIHFKVMALKVRAIWQAMQSSEAKSEEASRQLRRSLYVVEDIWQGQPFTEENVRSIRPAYGMPPKELPMVLKSTATCNISRGTALELWMLMPF